MTARYTFRKEERLTGKSHIDHLFNQGKSLGEYPFRVLYLMSDAVEDFPARILIAVPRKKFKRAVDRNRIRRLIREAYRLNRQILEDKTGSAGPCMHIAFIYTGDTVNISFTEVETRIKTCLERLQRNRLTMQSQVSS